MKKTICPKMLLLSVFGAISTALILIFPQIGWLEWVSFVPIFFAFFATSEHKTAQKRCLYGLGFLTVFAYYICLYHWFFDIYPLDFLGMDDGSSVVVILTAWIGLSLLQAIPGGLVFLLSGIFCNGKIARKYPLLKVFFFSASYVVFEWSSTLGWIGVPWGRLCLGQMDFLPFLQSASLFGSYFVDFLILSVNGLLAYGISEKRKRTVCLISAVGILFFNCLFGVVSLHFPQKADGEAIKVGVVQGNISSYDKWDSSSFAKTESVYADLVKKAKSDGAEIVVLPESVFPYFLNDNSVVQKSVQTMASENEVDLLVGSFFQAEDGGAYNVLYSVFADGEISETVYAKRHLVPFGEYVPARSVFEVLIPPLADLSAFEDELSPGGEVTVLDTSFGKVGGLICFDSIYERLTIDSVNDGAEWLAVASNDSWFFDSAAVYQHEAQSVLRAIESGKYVVRAANTGISSVITPQGEHAAYLEPLTEGYAVAEISAISGKTLYGTIGNLFVLLCGVFAVSSFVCEFVVFGKKKTE